MLPLALLLATATTTILVAGEPETAATLRAELRTLGAEVLSDDPRCYDIDCLAARSQARAVALGVLVQPGGAVMVVDGTGAWVTGLRASPKTSARLLELAESAPVTLAPVDPSDPVELTPAPPPSAADQFPDEPPEPRTAPREPAPIKQAEGCDGWIPIAAMLGGLCTAGGGCVGCVSLIASDPGDCVDCFSPNIGCNPSCNSSCVSAGVAPVSSTSRPSLVFGPGPMPY